MEFYERLKNLRKQANLTQADFANKLGVHFQTISKWERGTTLPDISMLGIIADNLSVSLEELLSVKTDKMVFNGNFDQKELAQVIAFYRKEKGLSQTELAQKLNVSADAVSKWERSVISPDMVSLVNMSKEFDVSLSALYYGKKQKIQKILTKQPKKSFRWVLTCSLVVIILLLGGFCTYLLIPKIYTVNVEGYSSYQVKGGENFTPTEPKKQGYKLIGYKDALGKTVEFPLEINGNLTVYPQFEIKTYKISYELDGGAFDTSYYISYTINDVGKKLPTPKKEGSTFKGWYITENFSGLPRDKIEYFDRGICYYAKWEVNKYTITYHLDGGSTQSNPTTVDFFTQIKLNEPTKTGYEFLGWYDAEEGGTKYTYVGGNSAKNLVLYAKWKKVDKKNDKEENIVVGNQYNFEYTKSNGCVTITLYKGKYGDNVNLVIPNYIEGLPVTTIGKESIDSSKGLRSIKLPSTLISIETFAINIKYVFEPLIIPSSVKYLGSNCISGKISSLQFEQESSLKTLWAFAFETLRIEDVFVLPEGVTEIQENSLPLDSMGIILPNSLCTIDKAFNHIQIREGGKIYIPSSVKVIAPFFWRWTIYTDKPDNYVIRQAVEEGDIIVINKSTITLLDGDEVVDTLEGYVFNLPKLEKSGYTFMGWKDEQGNYVSKCFVNEKGLSRTLRADFKEQTANDGRDQENAIVIDGDVLKSTIYTPATSKLYLTLDYDEEKYYLSILFEKSTLICVCNNGGGTNLIELYQNQEIIIYNYIDKDLEIEFSSCLSCVYSVKVNITLISKV